LEKNVIDIVIMKGLHTVMCTELDHLPLPCHVTEHTTVLRDVTPSSLTCTDISYNMLPLPAVPFPWRWKQKVSPKRLQTLHPITHY